ncbi:MAG TPA: hypothetical protein VGI39_09900 [Polyangiaceae bacterium]|jgi:hypothetical protein
MQLVDRIEKRRFVGREFLIWLWFESETFEGTLHVAAHGEFGLWIERSLVLTSGKEGTRIKGAQPAYGREAKESLCRGKLPESAGFHLVQGDRESSFTLRAERLGVAALKLPTVLGAEADEAPVALLEGPKRPPKRKREDKARQDARESDEAHEAFYERMQLTRDFEVLVEALYADFLAIRLGDSWDAIAAVMRSWATGAEVDADAYRALRDRALGGGKRRSRAAG